jgi:hypothetical protein
LLIGGDLCLANRNARYVSLHDREMLSMDTTTRKQRRRVGFAALLTLMTAAISCEASAGTIDRIRQDKVIRIAYRTDAPPFSFKGSLADLFKIVR